MNLRETRAVFAQHMEETAPELIKSARFRAQGDENTTLSVRCSTLQEALLVIAAATSSFRCERFYEGAFERVELTDGRRAFVVTAGAPITPSPFESVAPGMGDEGVVRSFFASTCQANTSLPFRFTAHGPNNATLRIDVGSREYAICVLGSFGAALTPGGFVVGADFQAIEVFDGQCLYTVGAISEMA